MERIYAYSGLVLAMILWGGSFVAAKVALAAYPPFTVVFGRMVIASFVFLLLWKRIIPQKWCWSDFKYLLAMALMEPCFYFVFEGYALKYTTAGQASLIVSTLPLMVGICATFILKEELKLRMVAGFLISILGVFLLTWGASASETSPNPLLGNVLEFLAMVMATGYTLIVRYLSPRYNAIFLTAVQSFVGLLFFGLLATFYDRFYEFQLHFSALGSIVFLGLFVSVVAYWLYNYGIAKISASQAAAFGNMIPAFAIFIGWLVLGEMLSIKQIWSSLVIIFGVIISQDTDLLSFFRFMSAQMKVVKSAIK